MRKGGENDSSNGFHTQFEIPFAFRNAIFVPLKTMKTLSVLMWVVGNASALIDL